jgi:hypothetical protein
VIIINFYKKNNVYIDFDRNRIKEKAESYLNMEAIHITDVKAPLGSGGKHDYYSNGDYWWPNPNTEDGLPYIRRDGQTNPNNFNQHRLILRSLRNRVVALTAGFMVTNDERYSIKAITLLKEFFIDSQTKMEPHLLYGQAIPGRCTGRGVGIIDTLHLIGIPVAIDILWNSSLMSKDIYKGLKDWFADYLDWITTHQYGKDEMRKKNNHSVCWNLQAAVFAKFTNNKSIIELCKKQYKEVLLPEQMAINGSFPKELDRTKPYGYSIFVLDNMINLCYVLSNHEDNLWYYKTNDGKSIKKGLDFLYPYLLEKNNWPYKADVQHFEEWPVRISSLLFAGFNLNETGYIDLWYKLKKNPKDKEVKRNVSIREPYLWVNS